MVYVCNYADYRELCFLINDTTVGNALSALPGVVLEPLFAYHYIWRDWFRFTGMDTFNSSNDPWLENHIVNTYMISNYITFSNRNFSNLGVSVQQYHGGSGILSDFIGVPYNAMLKRICLLLPGMVLNPRFLSLLVRLELSRICVPLRLCRSLLILSRFPASVIGIKLRPFGMKLLWDEV